MKTHYRQIVILTGAGISAESGLATFRGNGGLWNNCNIEEVATIDALLKNPETVWKFYNDLKKSTLQAKPNAAHFALSELEKNYAGKVYIITQNVDTLHELAGSQKIFHIHGKITQAACWHCGSVSMSTDDINMQTVCPHCHKIASLRPNIVFFGEPIMFENNVQKLLKGCDLFVAIGTSGQVTPAAHFAKEAKSHGAETIAINLTTPFNFTDFNKVILGSASDKVPAFVNELLRAQKKAIQ